MTTKADPRTWAKLFPRGRDIFYEGDDPDGFAEEIAATFGFDPRSDHRWWDVIPVDGSDEFRADPYPQFYCPAEHLDAIYGNPEYPLGS